MRKYETPQKNLNFQIIQTEIQGICWGWILKVWDNGERNIKMDLAEFILMDPPSRDSVFNIVTWGIRKGSNSCLLVG